MVKPSRDSVGRASFAAVLIGGPRLVGVDQSSAVVSRLAVQMSSRPKPPGRFESKTISSPSLRTYGRDIVECGIKSGSELRRAEIDAEVDILIDAAGFETAGAVA